MIKVAIDAMGGDFGPKPIVSGVIEALEARDDFVVTLIGKESEIKSLVPTNLLNRVSFVESSEILEMSDHATDALKRKETSIYKAVELVRNKECHAVVSAGHSGATMSLATLRIGRISGVNRPAIATLMPTINKSRVLVLDVGANVDCKARNLYEFGIMGIAYAKEIMGIENPRLGIVSNGEEDSKGDEVTKEARELLRNLKAFKGNAEGSDIFSGEFDVVVCDGFIGNIILKTAEGATSAMSKFIKNEVKNSILAKFGALLMSGAFKSVKKYVDYDEYGGAPLLGVKDCVIISHGKSSPKAMKNAIFQALKFANSNIENIIEDRLKEQNGYLK